MGRSIATFGLLCGAALNMGCRSDSETVNAEEVIAEDAVLPAADLRRLRDAGWAEQVGDALGLWVSVDRQQLIGVRADCVRFIYDVSTAGKGVGNAQDSNMTPTGWHVIDERYGDGLPWGAIFESRRFTNQVWEPDLPTGKDLVLSRIMWLRGLEPGLNAGPGVDSHDRYIYIHGTPAEDKLGTPASMGCIRLSNDDVISLYEIAPSGTRVLITAR